MQHKGQHKVDMHSSNETPELIRLINNTLHKVLLKTNLLDRHAVNWIA